MLAHCSNEPVVMSGLTVELARNAADLRAAQRLRYRVFAEEQGARVPGGHRGLDCDEFDFQSDHLIVRDRTSGDVVGTYRLLDGACGLATGGLYSQTEFDLYRLRPLLTRTLEVGRACVHPSYRRGGVIVLLWSALMRYIVDREYAYVIGCASIPTTEGGAVAASVCRKLLQHRGPEEWRVFPYRAFVLEGWPDIESAEVPALIKSYLRLGAVVCGDPSWDPDFKTADVLILLPIAAMSQRYVNRLLRAA